MEVAVDRWDVKVSLEPAFWSADHAELNVSHSDGTAEISRDEARLIAKMLLEWADAPQKPG